MPGVGTSTRVCHAMRERRGRGWLVVATMLLMAALAGGPARAHEAGTPLPLLPGATPPASCPVTIPNGDVPPFGNLGFFPGPIFHGDNGIWASFGADGTVAWQPAMGNGPGAYGVKFLWFHDERARGHLQVTGTFLGGGAPPLVAEVPDGYGEVGYQASGLIFSRFGCWRVTASAGGSSMTFTIWLYEGMPKSLTSDWLSPAPPRYCHVTQPSPTNANPAAQTSAPIIGAIPTGNEQIVVYLPSPPVFQLVPKSTAGDAAKADATHRYGPVVLIWWLNPRIMLQPLVAGEQVVGYGGSGQFDDVTNPVTGSRYKSALAFSSPGCWHITLQAGSASYDFTIWLWTGALPLVATPAA